MWWPTDTARPSNRLAAAAAYWTRLRFRIWNAGLKSVKRKYPPNLGLLSRGFVTVSEATSVNRQDLYSSPTRYNCGRLTLLVRSRVE